MGPTQTCQVHGPPCPLQSAPGPGLPSRAPPPSCPSRGQYRHSSAVALTHLSANPHCSLLKTRLQPSRFPSPPRPPPWSGCHHNLPPAPLPLLPPCLPASALALTVSPTWRQGAPVSPGLITALLNPHTAHVALPILSLCPLTSSPSLSLIHLFPAQEPPHLSRHTHSPQGLCACSPLSQSS